MTAISFSNLVMVAAVAFMAPLVLGQFPRLRLPSVVLELVLGIAIGPSGLGWVHSDVPVKVLSLVGLAFLLFLAGLDVELERLRGRLLRLAALGFFVSVGLALSAGYALRAIGQVRNPLFIGIVLSATAVGLVAPVLKDAGQTESMFGQLVLAGATMADFGTIVLLSTMQANALFPGSTIYAAQKAALQHAALILAKELRGPSNIRVNVVSPGVVPTPAYNTSLGMTEGQVDEFVRNATANIPLGRAGAAVKLKPSWSSIDMPIAV